MPLNIKTRAVNYAEPFTFILLPAIIGFFGTFLARLITSPLTAFNISDLQSSVFAAVFALLSPKFKEGESATRLPGLVGSASGVVLELGPGTGNQLSRYDRAKVKKVFGVEPNRQIRDSLQKAIEKEGLESLYEVVPLGIEDRKGLEERGLGEGSVDTVLSVQVLCSVKSQEQVCRELYRVLKPGGTLIFYEHQQSKDFVSSSMQCKFLPTPVREVGKGRDNG
jgi:SAM-dependent methyltransferase